MTATLAEKYREAERLAGGACPIESGVIGRLADHECRHGRLAGDRSPACGCWPEEGAPDLMGVFTQAIHEKEQQMQTQDPEAPFGRKADGTPRKRPAPSPAQIAAAQAGRRRAVAERAAAKLAAPPRVAEPAATLPAAASPLLARVIGELDAEIARLQQARQALEAVAA